MVFRGKDAPPEKQEFFDQLHLRRRAAQVRRFHTVRMNKEQSLAEHQYGVAQFCRVLMAEAGGVSKAVLLAALDHDLPELVTGDIPAPVKAQSFGPDGVERLGILERKVATTLGIRPVALTTLETWVLEMADLLDGLYTTCDDLYSGNRHAREVHWDYSARACDLASAAPTRELTLLALDLIQQGEHCDVSK